MARKVELEIERLRSLFPASIEVSVERSQDGGFFANISTFPGCVTQADSFSELIEMVNDAVRTYFEIPEGYLPHMPTYLPPVQVVRRLDVFPVVEKRTNIQFRLPSSNEAVAC